MSGRILFYKGLLKPEQLNRTKIELRRYPEASEIKLSRALPILNNVADILSKRENISRANETTYFTITTAGIDVTDEGDDLIVVINLEDHPIDASIGNTPYSMGIGDFLIYVRTTERQEITLSTSSGNGLVALLITHTNS